MIVYHMNQEPTTLPKEGMGLRRLKELRQARGLSLTQLAFKAQIHPSNLSKLEAGFLPLYPNWKRRLAQALGVKEEELEDGEPQ